MISPLILYVDVPFATFRESHSREYGKTYPVPPPATVYGMLLSLVGETDVFLHCGVKLAIAILSQPRKSQIIRQMRRFKKAGFSNTENINPAYQEMISNLKCLIWVCSQREKEKPNLQERVELALENPRLVNRFGCLFLGESDNLVNQIKVVAEDYHCESLRQWVIRDNRGRLTLPYWVDHLGSRNTRCFRYRLLEMEQLSPPPLAWTIIQSPF